MGTLTKERRVRRKLATFLGKPISWTGHGRHHNINLKCMDDSENIDHFAGKVFCHHMTFASTSQVLLCFPPFSLIHNLTLGGSIFQLYIYSYPQCLRQHRSQWRAPKSSPLLEGCVLRRLNYACIYSLEIRKHSHLIPIPRQSRPTAILHHHSFSPLKALDATQPTHTCRSGLSFRLAFQRLPSLMRMRDHSHRISMVRFVTPELCRTCSLEIRVRLIHPPMTLD